MVKQNVAVVGGGVSGIVAAYILSKKHNVTLFESSHKIGGHTNTVVLANGPDKGAAIDTGFIVLNNKNYPLLHKFLSDLDVPVRWSNMSFGYHCSQTGFEYSGDNLNTLFCDRLNILRPKFYKFIFELIRFSNLSLKELEMNNLSNLSLGDFLKKNSFKDLFVQHYLIPMAAAIWSAPDKDILNFSAEMFVRFFKNHGLLSLKNRPRWQTVEGGSHSYLKKFEQSFPGDIRLSSPVKSLSKRGSKVELVYGNSFKEEFDSAVMACHADQSFQILSDDFIQLKSVIEKWRYQKNIATLHTDVSVLPKNKRCWSSWNYRRVGKEDDSPVFVSYYMNMLQGLNVHDDFIVTLNSQIPIDKSKTIAEFVYEHPVFNQDVLDTSKSLKKVNGENQVYLCGSYTGNGFHEDGVRSATEVAKLFGMEL